LFCGFLDPSQIRREQAGREASPTAEIDDIQRVKSARSGQAIKRQQAPPARRWPRLPLHATIHAADIKHRDGGLLLIGSLGGSP
jgi:hypothetical protein